MPGPSGPGYNGGGPNPPPDPGGNGGSGTHGYSGPGNQTATQRFENHPVRFLKNHPGQTGYFQRYLRGQGYHIALDGKLGPQTLAAAKAYKKGIAAKHFNSHNRYSLSYKAPAPAKPGGGSGGGGGGGNRPRRGGGGGGGGGGRAPRGAGLKPINANKYAAAETALQYGDVLNELYNQRAQLTAQNAQDLADVKSWYGTAADMAANGTQSDAAAAQAAQGQQSNELASILSAIGGSAAGPAASSLGNFGQMLAAALAGEGQAQHGFDTASQTNIQGDMASALTSQQNAGDQAMSDLQSKLAQTLSDKGNALAKNRMDAQQLRLQQLAGIQNMQMLGAEEGLKLQGMKLQNQNTKLANQALGKQMAQQLSGTKFHQLTAGDRSKLGQGVNAVMYGNNMSTKFNPKQAWERAANMLRSLGYSTKSDPAVRSYLSQLWLNYVGDWNHANPNKQYKPAKNGTPFSKW